MQRLNRADSRQRTREAILEAARDLFLEKGFRATGLEEIAETAGYTTGAVYSNFENKTAIGIAVIDALYAAEELRADALLAEAEATGIPWFEAVAQWAETAIGDRRWGRLEMEVNAATGGKPARSPSSAAADRYAEFRSRIGTLIESAAQRNGVRLPLPPETLAAAVVGLGLGLGIQRVADPELPAAQVFTSVLREIVSATVTVHRPA